LWHSPAFDFFLRYFSFGMKALFGLSLLLWNLSCVFAQVEEEEAPFTPVMFEDSHLESVLRKTLKKTGGAIVRRDMGSLRSFSAVRMKVVNLSGLEFARNITELSLHSNEIIDLSPLAGLIRLRKLHLQGNRIHELKPLSRLVNLTELRLSGNRIENLAPLVNLVSLTKLDLTGNQVSVVAPLSKMKKLHTLWLDRNRVGDVRPLVGLQGLKSLTLYQNRIPAIQKAFLTKALSGTRILF